MADPYKRISKTMSLALRHDPAFLGLTLSDTGWVQVEKLLEGLARKGMAIDLDTLKDIVHTNDKKRFAFSPDQQLIRANQGHSVAVDLELKAVEPPHTLYHGTVHKFVNDIRRDGLKKMSRTHVHLSKDKETATRVGSRRGKPVILKIEALKMNNDGYPFYLSDNGVWLTEHVPSKYIMP